MHVQRWHYAVNTVHKTAELVLEEVPVFVALVAWFFDLLCPFLPLWRVPFVGQIRVRRAEDGIDTTVEQYCGDTVRELYDAFVHVPVIQWAWYRTTAYFVPVDYEIVKSIFYERDRNDRRYQDMWEGEEDA